MKKAGLFRLTSIGGKFTVLTISIVIIAMVLLFATMQIQQDRQLKEEVKNFEIAEKERIKQTLKNYVTVAYETIEAEYKNAQDNAYLQKTYGLRLEGIIDTAYSILAHKVDLYESGALSLREAQNQAMQEINKIRYDDGTGYIWINDMGTPIPRMIMHPTVPSLDGQILDDPNYNCAYKTDKNLFQAFVDVCRASGEGYVDYLWPKPTESGLTEDQPKLSYVRLFEPWEWVIGTGIYIDDAVVDAKEKSLSVIKNMRYDGGTGYFWVNDTTLPIPTMIMHPTVPDLDGKVLDDPNYNCAYGTDKNLFQAFAEVCLASGEGYVDYLWPKPTESGLTEDLPKLSYVQIFEPWDWIVGTGAYIDSIDMAVAEKAEAAARQTANLTRNMIIVTAILIIGSIFFTLVFSRKISKSLFLVSNLSKEIAEGNLSMEKPSIKSRDEVGILAGSFGTMLDSLNKVLSQVNDAVDQVSSGADQVAQASQALSQGATEQASSLEEISASLNEVNSQSNQNAETAGEANAIAKTAAENAEKGNEQMKQLLNAMSKIGDSSDEIRKVVKVIEDIAFQINLLALNANVEAARAGKYGKGFAVVAEEVRNLAVRSADAVKETTKMVDEVTENIQEGTKGAENTAGQLEEIANGSTKVADFLGEIALASKEQAQGVEQINDGVGQIDQVTQSNTASAEESAAAAEQLSAQAEQLKALVAKFKLAAKSLEKTEALQSKPEKAQPPHADSSSSSAETQREMVGVAVQDGPNGSPHKQTVKPKDVIKLDDDDFGKF